MAPLEVTGFCFFFFFVTTFLVSNAFKKKFISFLVVDISLIENCWFSRFCSFLGVFSLSFSHYIVTTFLAMGIIIVSLIDAFDGALERPGFELSNALKIK